MACHWIRGRDHSELLWVVGDASQFNDQGAVPTNTTASNVLRTGDENAWHHLPLITALAALAALLHDLGKATQAFQDKLKNPGLRERNHYRHEWVSVRLFQAFVGQDDDAGWLQRLADYAAPSTDAQAFESLWLDHASGRLLRDGLDRAPGPQPHIPFRPPSPPGPGGGVAGVHPPSPALPTRGDRHIDVEPQGHGRRKAHLPPFRVRAPLRKFNVDWMTCWRITPTGTSHVKRTDPPRCQPTGTSRTGYPSPNLPGANRPPATHASCWHCRKPPGKAWCCTIPLPCTLPACA